MHLFNCDAELKRMTFLDRTFKVEKVDSQFGGIHHDSIPTIPAADADSVVEPRFDFSILVSTILADNLQFDVHIFSKNKQRCIMIRFFQISVQSALRPFLTSSSKVFYWNQCEVKSAFSPNHIAS